MGKNSITPAAYSKQFVPLLARLLVEYTPPFEGRRLLLDPMSGPGRSLGEIAALGRFIYIGTDIEADGYEKAGQICPNIIWGDATQMVFDEATFSAAVVSPAYPNGCSDDFISTEDSVRNTYAHRLREHLGNDYRLHPNNSGGMNPRRSPKALAKFYETHAKIWAEVYRVLIPGAPFVVNMKDTLKVEFTKDTWAQLEEAGFIIVNHIEVPIKGLNHGKNMEKKVGFEDIIVAMKPPTDHARVAFPQHRNSKNQ